MVILKQFMNDKFLLENDSAVKLYQEYACKMPIIDYHCHLDAKEIFDNKQFLTITEMWLYGDYYKWRAMRNNGIDEQYISGNASDYDKFLAWVKTLEKCIGNPLYHWTHLELQRYFEFHEPLTEKNALEAWMKINALLERQEYSVRSLIRKSNVKILCTTNDPVDSLVYHRIIREDTTVDFQVLPTFRPDKGLEISDAGFVPWIEQLGNVVNVKITSYDEFLAALQQRIDFFHDMGCRSADHALEKPPYLEGSQAMLTKIFEKAVQGILVSDSEVECYKTAVLQYCAKQYAKLGWAMQLHIGVMRNTNSRMLKALGPNCGIASSHDHPVAYNLAKFFDSLESEGCLPKTILYAINPKDYSVISTMLGNYQSEGIPGKIQFGAAWWLNDHKTGMIEQMTALGNVGLLSQFVGMVTDSRSFLSFSRHEYFRRILCNLIGEWIENGEVPANWDRMGGIVQDICVNNTKRYFGFKIK